MAVKSIIPNAKQIQDKAMIDACPHLQTPHQVVYVCAVA